MYIYTKQLLEFIENSPTAYQAVESAAKILDEQGIVRLGAQDEWKLEPGSCYYTVQNGTSIIAFCMPAGKIDSIMLAASHSDSPTFKLKANCEADAFGDYVKLNTERYGGMILSTWLDKPLSLAGRLVVKDGDTVKTVSVKVDRDLVLIPNVAIHQNRKHNDGYVYNAQTDMMPLYGMASAKGTLIAQVAESAGVKAEDVIGSDLYLYNRTPATIWGAENAFFSAPRIDNLMCAYGTLLGFIQSRTAENTLQVWACFDNEETGSRTKQGAGALWMRDTLERVCEANGTDLRRVLPASMMLSADNAHAKHPNHPELSDAQNAPRMGGGVVIKANASQSYATDGISCALFSEMCKREGVPTQSFANRSDAPGGSTLGSIADTLLPMNTVDIGMAQLAMHSSYETAACADNEHLVNASRAFFETAIKLDAQGNYHI
ncbi:MAG: M18 family aminopeptidase [Clostridia bacterium]|nr:M18 family aminopeptidase [Clostridia bacterium]